MGAQMGDRRQISATGINRHPAEQFARNRAGLACVQRGVDLGAPGVLRAGQFDVPAGVVAPARAAQGGAVGQQAQFRGVVVDGVEFLGRLLPHLDYGGQPQQILRVEVSGSLELGLSFGMKCRHTLRLPGAAVNNHATWRDRPTGSSVRRAIACASAPRGVVRLATAAEKLRMTWTRRAGGISERRMKWPR